MIQEAMLPKIQISKVIQVNGDQKSNLKKHTSPRVAVKVEVLQIYFLKTVLTQHEDTFLSTSVA